LPVKKKSGEKSIRHAEDSLVQCLGNFVVGCRAPSSCQCLGRGRWRGEGGSGSYLMFENSARKVGKGEKFESHRGLGQLGDILADVVSQVSLSPYQNNGGCLNL